MVVQRLVVDDEYVITDKDLRIHVRVARDLLENPSFDLVGWYIDYLSQQDMYGRSQEDGHTRSCCWHSHDYEECINTSEALNQSMSGLALESDHDSEGSEYDDLPDLIPLDDTQDEDNS